MALNGDDIDNNVKMYGVEARYDVSEKLSGLRITGFPFSIILSLLCNTIEK
jgi:hypothetical protein